MHHLKPANWNLISTVRYSASDQLNSSKLLLQNLNRKEFHIFQQYSSLGLKIKSCILLAGPVLLLIFLWNSIYVCLRINLEYIYIFFFGKKKKASLPQLLLDCPALFEYRFLSDRVSWWYSSPAPFHLCFFFASLWFHHHHHHHFAGFSCILKKK